MDVSGIEIIRYVTAYADKAHGDQVRKYSGEKYIVHPVRVMEMVREFNNDIRVLSAAILHDVLEDTPVTGTEMESALLEILDPAAAAQVVALVTELTDIFIKSAYPGLNRRTRKDKEARRLSLVSPEAQSVKYADIIDNVSDIVRQDADFARTYVREARRMLMLMESGHPVLRERAIRLVEESLPALPKPAEWY
ncbi:MAG: HD domain-containing protein [Chryseosolibacter sp.]